VLHRSGGLRNRLNLNSKTKFCVDGDMSTELDLGGPIEMVRTEITVFRAVLEDVRDGGQDRCCDSADGFLWSAPALEPEELGSIVAGFLALGRPCALHQHGLEPGRALAQARRLAFAGAFVLAGTQSAPGDEMSGARETAHITADLRQDRGGRHRADARDRAQKIDQGAKGSLAIVFSYAWMRSADRARHRSCRSSRPGHPIASGADRAEAMVIRPPPVQRVIELLGRRLEPFAGKLAN
jgi:hypothetical protein